MERAGMASKNVLMLINNAPFVRQFSVRLGEALVAQGHRVAYALDSRASDFMDPWPLPGPAHYFTDYLAQDCRDNPTLPPDACEGLTWEHLFSDIDRYIAFETSLPGGTELYRRVVARLQPFFREILAEHKIDLVVYEGVTNSFARAAYDVCAAGDARYLALAGSRIPGRMEFQASGFPENDWFNRTYSEFLEHGLPGPTAKVVDEYLSGFLESIPDYMKLNQLDQLSITAKYLKTEKLVRLLRQVRYAIKERQDYRLAYQTTNPLRWSLAFLRRACKRRLRQMLLRRYFDPVVPGEKYYLYPLHFHPEASTSVFARYYVDEIAVIKNIAFSLPLDSVLYVKEHPSGQYLNPLDFYSALAKMPNVKIIHPGANTKLLIKNSQGVFTLTSTAGLEACILKKPVFILGDAYYEWFDCCYKIDRYADIPKAIQWGRSFQPPSDAKVRAFAGTMVAYSRPGLFDYREVAMRNDVFTPFFDQFSSYLAELG